MKIPNFNTRWDEGYELTFDFETHDPELKTRGSCYLWNPSFRVLGMGYAIDDGEEQYTTDLEEMRELIRNAGTLIAHNAFYELSMCRYLEVEYKYKKVYCTQIGSKLDYNQRKSHALDMLGRSKFKLAKDQQRFGRLLLEHTEPDGSKLFDYPDKYYTQKRRLDDPEYLLKQTQATLKRQQKKAEKEDKKLPLHFTSEERCRCFLLDEARAYCAKTELGTIKKATAWAMNNLHIVNEIAPEMIAEYCKSDVKITRKLHRLWLSKLPEDQYRFFSDTTKICVDMRHKGTPIDVEKAKEVYEILDKKAKNIENRAKEQGLWCNWASPKQLAEMLENQGVVLPYSDKGNPQCSKDVLETIDHPVANMITLWRKYTKFRDDFVGKMIEWNVNGRIHGTMKPLGAFATGRFSHVSPNLGNIPSRDKELAPLIRSLFKPEKKKKWLHCDFSAQEPRLYVHWSVLCHKHKFKYKEQIWDRRQGKFVFKDKFTTFSCPMVLDLQKEYKKNPKLDSHQYNIDLIKKITGVVLERTFAKAIVLGQAYGKGEKSQARDMKLTQEKTRELTNAFTKASPFVKMGSDAAQYQFVKQGYVKTILGRKNCYDGVGYRAWNYKIQGSAADQTTAALQRMYYELDVVPLTVVHDEVNVSGDEELGLKIQDIMINTIKLEIPSHSDLCIGDNWADAKG